ncbi:hypothetical protein HG530_007887 [Fusarium avenaceum]|nr:hypothetical protein HG530_007887 [Fusarium avenaceum]
MLGNLVNNIIGGVFNEDNFVVSRSMTVSQQGYSFGNHHAIPCNMDSAKAVPRQDRIPLFPVHQSSILSEFVLVSPPSRQRAKDKANDCALREAFTAVGAGNSFKKSLCAASCTSTNLQKAKAWILEGEKLKIRNCSLIVTTESSALVSPYQEVPLKHDAQGFECTT